MNDYHAFKSTSGGTGGGKNSGGGGLGCGWIVIVIVAFMLFHFIFSGASWDTIEMLLGLGLLAFFIARSLS